MANEHSQIVPSMQPTAKVADFKFWCQKVLPLVYDDSLSYYEVLNKMVVYLNQVIDNINADIDNVAELEDDFLLLQEYVNNFFDDIDQLATYAERAEAAETSALSSAASAAESASNSATSASNAAGSASTAASMATTALNAKDAAVAAKTAAETALANAQTAATNAAASATAASGSATNAAASAASALQNFQLSDAARTAAQSAAANAESDAADAADSAAEAVAAVDTIINGLGNISKTIENVPIATTEDALASIAKKLVVDIEPVQNGSGDPAPDNVRPITGWSGVNVMRAEKNLLDPKFYSGGAYNADVGRQFTFIEDTTVVKSGNVYSKTVEAYGVVTLVSPLLKAGTYKVNVNVSATSIRSTLYKLDRNFEVNFKSNTSIPQTWKNTLLLNDDGYIAISLMSTTAGDISFANPQIENGETFTGFEEYTGQNILITFPDAAGTVYGGTLTNEDGGWKLRVTDEQIASYNGEALPSTWISDRDVYASGTTPTIGAQVVYKLATPIEYTLTESQALTMLNGINNVWADTGNINTLEYFSNAENYVTSQIDLAKALIAPVLKEMKSDTALVANDFRIVGNTLYRITGNIASGGTLTPNTNCVATTVGEILKSLLSA